MVSSSIVVGRVIVDSDHADLARSLLSVENVLSNIGGAHDSGKSRVTESDEEYALRMQEEYLKDTLRIMEDYRLAKSLGEGNETSSYTIVDHSAMDHLRALLTVTPSEPFDEEPSLPKTEYNSTLNSFTFPADEDCLSDNLSESDLDEKTPSNIEEPVSRDFMAVVAEHRRARLASAIRDGLSGPSGYNSDTKSQFASFADVENMYNFGSRLPSPSGLSRSSTDPGDPDDVIDVNYKNQKNSKSIVNDNYGMDDEYGTDQYDLTDKDTVEDKNSIDKAYHPDNTYDIDDDAEDDNSMEKYRTVNNYGIGFKYVSVAADDMDGTKDKGSTDDPGDLNGMDNNNGVPPPVPDIREVLGDQFGFRTVFCTTCGDLVVGEPTLQAPCGHDICVDCVQDLVATAIRDESLFPPSCCHQPFPRENFTAFLTVSLQRNYDAKHAEFSTPVAERIFCSNSACSAFLGSSKAAKDTITCTRCATVVCTSCKVAAHPGDTCAENVLTSAVKRLAQAKRWQTCPTCLMIVEKGEGCNHILCRCKANFCYGCGGLMTACRCGRR